MHAEASRDNVFFSAIVFCFTDFCLEPYYVLTDKSSEHEEISMA